MISATRRWLRRNRTPIAIGVGVVGAGYVATQYVLGKINDARERMSSDRIAKENLRRRFEQNQEDCTFTVLALLPTATTSIIETMNTEQITYQIQQLKGARPAAGGPTSPPSIADTTLTEEDGRSMASIASLQSESGVHASQVVSASDGSDGKRKTKRQLWDELAISSISRAYTLLYTLSLLTMLTRIQLNLLGRRNYLSSVVSLATEPTQAAISLENNDDDNPDQTYGSDFDINRQYLTFSWWLLNKGWRDIMVRVESAVQSVFGHLSPRDELSLGAFHGLTEQVRKQVESGLGSGAEQQAGQDVGAGSPTKWLAFLLPPAEMEEAVLRDSGVLGDSAAASTQDKEREEQVEGGGGAGTSLSTVSPALRRLLDETSDLIESPAFSHVLSLLLDAGFSTLLDGQVAEAAFGSGSEAAARPTVQLPRILSVLTRQAHAIGHGMPNQYLQGMEAVRDLEAFAAVVYSSNWQNEMRDDSLMASAVDLRAAEADAACSIVGESAVLVPSQSDAERATVQTVLQDSQLSSFDSAWERAVEQKR